MKKIIALTAFCWLGLSVCAAFAQDEAPAISSAPVVDPSLSDLKDPLAKRQADLAKAYEQLEALMTRSQGSAELTKKERDRVRRALAASRKKPGVADRMKESAALLELQKMGKAEDAETDVHAALGRMVAILEGRDDDSEESGIFEKKLGELIKEEQDDRRAFDKAKNGDERKAAKAKQEATRQKTAKLAEEMRRSDPLSQMPAREQLQKAQDAMKEAADKMEDASSAPRAKQKQKDAQEALQEALQQLREARKREQEKKTLSELDKSMEKMEQKQKEIEEKTDKEKEDKVRLAGEEADLDDEAGEESKKLKEEKDPENGEIEQKMDQLQDALKKSSQDLQDNTPKTKTEEDEKKAEQSMESIRLAIKARLEQIEKEGKNGQDNNGPAGNSDLSGGGDSGKAGPLGKGAKGSGSWGNLPPQDRETVLQMKSDASVPEKYRELVYQYYRKLAEDGCLTHKDIEELRKKQEENAAKEEAAKGVSGGKKAGGER